MTGPSDDMPPRPKAPLFPLPNVVLFPGAILPLHIFEPRYKQMTTDALDGNGLVAMALLQAGWEKDYYGRAAIEPVVCVGAIMAHEKLDDGKFNLLLQGRWRATVVDESTAGGDTPYRLARLCQLAEQPALEIDLVDERQHIARFFDETKFGGSAAGRQFVRLLAGPMLTSEIADLIAFNFLSDVSLKQALLAEPDVRRRVERVVAELDKLRPAPFRSDEDASLN